MKLKTLIDNLERIATRNKDEFEYKIVLDNGEVEFVATETADNHDFFSIRLDDREVGDIEAGDWVDDLADACKNWGYEQA